MHLAAPDPLTLAAARRTNFILTASIDGVLKFWKKQPEGIEFVKLYRTHLSPIVSVGVSHDGKSAASLGADVGGKTAEGLDVKGSAKVFDVENFGACPFVTPFRACELTAPLAADMINILKLPYAPRTCCWVHNRNDGRTLLAMCASLCLSWISKY